MPSDDSRVNRQADAAEIMAILDDIRAAEENWLNWVPSFPQYIEGRIYLTRAQWHAVLEEFPPTGHRDPSYCIWGIPVDIVVPDDKIRLPSGKTLVYSGITDSLLIFDERQMAQTVANAFGVPLSLVDPAYAGEVADMATEDSHEKVFDAVDYEAVELLKRDPDAFFARKQQADEIEPDYPDYPPANDIWWTLGIALFALVCIVLYVVAHNQGWI